MSLKVYSRLSFAGLAVSRVLCRGTGPERRAQHPAEQRVEPGLPERGVDQTEVREARCWQSPR